MTEALTTTQASGSSGTSSNEVNGTHVESSDTQGSQAGLRHDEGDDARHDPGTSAVTRCEKADSACAEQVPQDTSIQNQVVHEATADDGPENAVSASAESCASLASAGSHGPPSESLLPYVNFCAQYAQQVATWCEQSESGPSKGDESLPAFCDSKRELVQRWLKRPARRQVLESEMQNYSHSEGQNEYNIWYGRHLTDRHNRASHLDRESAPYRCDPELDSGYTAADTQPGNSEAYFCAFFAKGCCTKGSECRYKHRVPTLEDEATLEWSRDIFGRERHRDHRDDMGGAGSFNHECKTLFVGGLQVDPLEEDGIRGLEKFLWEAFGAWGDVQAVRVIPKKLIGFVTYAYRVQAEFAKVAMADQNVGKYGSLLSVKWAHQDGNAKRKNSGEEEQSKKPRVEEAAAPQKPTEQREEDLVRQTLESYCSAWQAYWASCVREGAPTAHDKTLQPNHQPSVSVTSYSSRNSNEGEARDNGVSYGFTASAQREPTEETNPHEDADTQRLQSILSRIDGLSTSDFLKAGVLESSNTSDSWTTHIAYLGMKPGISLAWGVLLLLETSAEIVSASDSVARTGTSSEESGIEPVSFLEDQPAGAHPPEQNDDDSMKSGATEALRESSLEEAQARGDESTESASTELQKTPEALSESLGGASKEDGPEDSGQSRSSQHRSGSDPPSPPDKSEGSRAVDDLTKDKVVLKEPQGRRVKESLYKEQQSLFGRKLAAVGHSSDSEDSRQRSSVSKRSRQRKGGKRSRTQPTREEQLQVLRTVQLLNILIKHHKKQALEHAAPRGARIDPTSLALSFEDLLGKVHERRNTKEDEKAESGEEGLSWAAALILAIPPSLLAIILAHHIAKRQAGPMPAERRKELLASKRRFEEAGGEFKMDSDSDSSDDLLRAEAEAVAYVDYQPRHSVMFDEPPRIPRRALTSRNLPAYWAPKGRHSDFYRKVREPFPSEFEDALDHVYRRKRHATEFGYDGPATPLSHGYADADEYDLAWAQAPANEFMDEVDFRMHGGL
ncbi:hypothetical protein Emed_000285 [Eimeria media]